MTRFLDGVGEHREFVFLDPPGVSLIPTRLAAIRDDSYDRRVSEHRQRVLDGFIGPAINDHGLVSDATTIAVFAEEHAVAKALSDAIDFRRHVEDSGGDQNPAAAIG